MNRDTFVERNKQESPNDRNDRGNFCLIQFSSNLIQVLLLAIRTATEWYTKHFRNKQKKVLLITNDVENLNKAKAAGINSQTSNFQNHTLVTQLKSFV